jgi:hypothetical protein
VGRDLGWPARAAALDRERPWLHATRVPREPAGGWSMPPTQSSAGRALGFHKYRLNNGLHTDLYLLAYENRGLVFWGGDVSEFRRQPDAELNAALNTVLGDILAQR